MKDNFSQGEPQKTDTRPPGTVLPALEWAALLLAIALFTITETYRAYVTAGVGLLLVSSLMRVVRTRRWSPRTGMQLPAVLFVGSAGMATWVAYDRATASLQFVRILALVALFYAITESRENWLRWLAGGFLLAAAYLAVYWPMQNNFVTQPGKLTLITELGLVVNRLAGYPPALPGPSIHSNVAAGTLAMALPFGAALTWDLWKRSLRLLAWLAGALTLVVLAGLFMTSSRGAWLAVLGSLGLALLVLFQRRFLFAPHQKLVFWGGVVAMSLAGLAGIWLTGNLNQLVGAVPDASGGIQTRLQLWAQGFDLARDYPFTGIGLMTYWMTNGVYRLLVHTPIISHSHNSFLQVWVEQGIIGAIALAWAFITGLTWAWRALGKPAVPALGWGGLGALSVVSLHGLVDVVFFVERTLPLLGLALGYAWLAASPAAPQSRRSRNLGWITLAATAALAVIGVALIPTFRAAWYANLGAVQQTRLELAAYDPDHFDNPTLDQIRRGLDLRSAEAAFHKALAIDPANRTALQRLAQISLSRGEYAAGLEYTLRLWQAGRRDEITRMLYSEALAANQNPAQAADVVRGVTWGEMRLRGQAWYRYWIHQDYQRAADAWKAVLLLDPLDKELNYWLEQALDRLK